MVEFVLEITHISTVRVNNITQKEKRRRRSDTQEGFEHTKQKDLQKRNKRKNQNKTEIQGNTWHEGFKQMV